MNAANIESETEFRKLVENMQESVALHEDVTVKRSALQELKDQEERLRTIFDTSQAGIILGDSQGVITFANRRMGEMLACPVEELAGSNYSDHIHPDDLPDSREKLDRLLTGKTHNLVSERLYLRKDGSNFWGYLTASRIDDESGRLKGLVGVISDISENKRAEQERITAQLRLAESEQRYRSVIENLQDVFYRSDAAGRLTMISPSGVQLLGYNSAEEMLGCVIRDTFYNDSLERDVFVHNLKIKGHLNGYEVTLKRKDGTPVPVATSTHLIYGADGAIAGVEGVFRDISSQRAAETALRNSEEKFSKAFSQAPLLMSIGEIETGKYLEVNNRFCEISGFSPEEVIGRTSLELGWITAAERDRYVVALKRDGQLRDFELALIAKDGRQVVSLHSAVIISYGGSDRLLSIGLDMTDRKRTEKLLRESEERYRQLVEQSSAWIWKTDSNLKHTYSNENVEKILGYSVEELCDMDILNLVHPDDHDALRRTVDQAVSSRRGWSGLVLRWLARDGSWRYIESSGVALFDENGSFVGLQGVDTDVTDRLDLQQEREKRQRLESLGLLAGGIAHDFNNILTGIVGNLSLARMMIDSDHRASGRLGECEKAAKRASELTQQLLTFARGGEPVKKTVETSKLINEAVSFGLRGSNIRAEVELDIGLWGIDADEGQINQVLNNLLINASQAMPDGGTVIVRGENIVAEDASAPVGRFVRIVIQDSGVGIPAEILSKVFDPYFTTKSGGTGLGLASVYSIVKRHGGRVNVSSEVGNGTEFEIYLPAAAEKELCQQAVPIKTKIGADCIGRVLVMDDEEMIIEVVSIMLVELGCTVEACSNGTEAVELYRTALEQGMPYDAVILDLTIPGGMGGMEVAHKIIEIDPKATLIVSSGYSQDAVMADFRGHGFSGAVEKPYTLEALSEELYRVKIYGKSRLISAELH